MRALASGLTLLFVVLLGGCGGSGPSSTTSNTTAPTPATTSSQPLGEYLAPSGDALVFHRNGQAFHRFPTGGMESGPYTVNGSTVSVQLNPAMPAIALTQRDADTLLLVKPGRPDVAFRRVQSPKTQEVMAERTTPPPPAAPALDPSVPLDRYEPLTDARTFRLLAMALVNGTLSEDDKLTMVPEAHSIHDAFARRELAAKALPALDRELDAVRGQRYRKLDVATFNTPATGIDPTASPAPALRSTWWFESAMGGPLPLRGAYDFDRKGFPGPCLDASTLVAGVGNVSLRPTTFHPADKGCVLPVADV